MNSKPQLNTRILLLAPHSKSSKSQTYIWLTQRRGKLFHRTRNVKVVKKCIKNISQIFYDAAIEQFVVWKNIKKNMSEVERRFQFFFSCSGIILFFQIIAF